jgi:hypothetical protein
VPALSPETPLSPALPDPRADPLAALHYSARPGLLQSAAITVTDAITLSQIVGGGYLEGLSLADGRTMTEEEIAAKVVAAATIVAAPATELPFIANDRRSSGTLRVAEAAVGKVDYRLDYTQSSSSFLNGLWID